MKIIKKGEYKPIVFYFKCDICGTIFEAAKDETKIMFDRNEYVYMCKCPICHKWTSSKMEC